MEKYPIVDAKRMFRVVCRAYKSERERTGSQPDENLRWIGTEIFGLSAIQADSAKSSTPAHVSGSSIAGAGRISCIRSDAPMNVLRLWMDRVDSEQSNNPPEMLNWPDGKIPVA